MYKKREMTSCCSMTNAVFMELTDWFSKKKSNTVTFEQIILDT